MQIPFPLRDIPFPQTFSLSDSYSRSFYIILDVDYVLLNVLSVYFYRKNNEKNRSDYYMCVRKNINWDST